MINLPAMKMMKWIAVLAAGLVLASCFFPWVTIPAKGIIIGGFESTVADYGKPGVFHSFFCGIYILFMLFNRVWSVRAAFFISAFNIAWAIRNFVLISTCKGGECPQKQAALYLVLAGSVAMALLIFFVRVDDRSRTVR